MGASSTTKPSQEWLNSRPWSGMARIKSGLMDPRMSAVRQPRALQVRKKGSAAAGWEYVKGMLPDKVQNLGGMSIPVWCVRISPGLPVCQILSGSSRPCNGLSDGTLGSAQLHEIDAWCQQHPGGGTAIPKGLAGLASLQSDFGDLRAFGIQNPDCLHRFREVPMDQQLSRHSYRLKAHA